MTSESGQGDREDRIVAALAVRSLKLAGMYRTVLSTLATPPADGCEAARISVICHCMRELMNGLPAAMAETIIPRPEPSSGSLLAKLPGLLGRHPEVDLNLDQDVVPVPREVAQGLGALVTARTQEDGRNRSNTAALVTGGRDTRHPAIEQWSDAYAFFMRWTHLDRNAGDDRPLPVNAEIRSFMRVVEDVIDVRTTAFFENVHVLRDLLAEINAIDGEEE